MPNYLVSLPESQTVGNQTLGAKSMVIFAADAAGARRAAEGRLDGDGNVQWSDSATTVVELVVGADLADAGDDLGWSAFARIEGAAAQVATTISHSADGKTKDDSQGILGKTRLHIGAIALNDGGIATYVIDEILTVAGGTFTRAATIRVITVSTGVILTAELVDPGEYTVLPTMTGNLVTGGGGTTASFDLTATVPNDYISILAQLTTELAADTELTASIDLSEGAAGTRLLTVATIGDGLGDGTLEVEIRHNGTVETVLMGTIVHEDVGAAVLTAAIPASPIAPPRIHVYNHSFL